MPRRPLLLLLALATSSCAAIRSLIPVEASPADLAALTGEWTGSYESRAADRTGSIVFRLQAGTDTAVGDVMMSPRLAGVHLSAAGVGSAPEPATTAGELLTIRFVRVNGGRVYGVLDPYIDPECRCELRTAFMGEIAGDRIVGTFQIRGLPRGQTRGTWRVERRR